MKISPPLKLSYIISSLKCKRAAVLAILIFILVPVAFNQPPQGSHCKQKDSMPALLQHPSRFSISGRVTQTFPYCGGAKPPEELVKKLAIPVAYPNKQFYIREGNTNSINAKITDSFRTDSDGSFSIQLAAGTYSIIVIEQLKEIKLADYTKKHEVPDAKCLQDWWAKPYYLLEVKDKNIGQLNFVFNHRCYISGDVPCITYTGPLHP